jgi:hypothetical protein
MNGGYKANIMMLQHSKYDYEKYVNTAMLRYCVT